MKRQEASSTHIAVHLKTMGSRANLIILSFKDNIICGKVQLYGIPVVSHFFLLGLREKVSASAIFCVEKKSPTSILLWCQ